MIHVLSNNDRATSSHLFRRMFRTRAEVFHDKLGWAVEIHDGLEYDRHDDHSDPIYIVLTDETNDVVGSLRLLPTTGDTMMTGEFAYMFDEPVDVRSPTIWECTRFCVPYCCAPGHHVAAGRTSSDLLIALCDYCMEHGIDQVLGLYEAPMSRIYRRIGWSPSVLARSKPEVGHLLAGIWDATETALGNMRRLARRGVGEAAIA